MNTIDGLGVAIATPFDESLGIDYEAFERLLDFLVGRDF
ncbi:MAG: 4-hydroxy-tetrahydrodipicolinate synthase, partial [Treponema sp.]|nr:4-hydroxy-tetrahydrodipicolinate synthase [Treponema sp.]